MRRYVLLGALTLALTASTAGLTGCETLRTPVGAGAATGAAAGALIGEDVESAVIGGAVGGATGYVIDKAND